MKNHFKNYTVKKILFNFIVVDFRHSQRMEASKYRKIVYKYEIMSKITQM